eukprot:g2525.t1
MADASPGPSRPTLRAPEPAQAPAPAADPAHDVDLSVLAKRGDGHRRRSASSTFLAPAPPQQSWHPPDAVVSARERTSSDMDKVLEKIGNERLERQWALTHNAHGHLVDLSTPRSPVPAVKLAARRGGSSPRHAALRRLEPPGLDLSGGSDEAKEAAPAPLSSLSDALPPKLRMAVPQNQSLVVDVRTKVALALGEAGPQAVNFIASLYMQYFLLEHACVHPYVAAAVMLLAGLGVIVADVFLFGLASSKSGHFWLTTGPFDRPRALVWGPPLLALGYFMFWTLSLSIHSSHASKLFYFLTAMVMIGIGGSAMQRTVSHLNISLTPDHEERSTIATWRIGLGNVLALVCLATHATIIRSYREKGSIISDLSQAETEAQAHTASKDAQLDDGYSLSGYILSGLLLLLGWVSAYCIKAPQRDLAASPPVDSGGGAAGAAAGTAAALGGGRTRGFSIAGVGETLQGGLSSVTSDFAKWRESVYSWQEGRVKFARALRIVFSSRAFRYLSMALFCGIGAIALFEANLLMYLTYRVHMSYNFVQIALVIQVGKWVFMPFWSWMAWHANKKVAYRRAGVVLATAFFLLVFLQDGGFLGWHVVVFALGIGTSSGVVLLIPSAMLSDVVDDDLLRMKRGRRMRVFKSMFSLVERLTIVFALAISNIVLAGSGYSNPPGKCDASYNSTANDVVADQSTTVGLFKDGWKLDVIRTLMGGAPAVLILLSAFFVHRYPIDQHVEAENFNARVRTNSIRRASFDQDALNAALAMAAQDTTATKTGEA